MTRPRRARAAALAAGSTLAAAAVTVVAWTGPAAGSPPGEGSSRAWPYWKTDLHAHSVVSGDATVDPGVIADNAKARGFNAVFLTDHQAASYNTIGGVIASHVSFEDDAGTNRQWDDVPGTPNDTASAGLSTAHVLNGVNSYRSAVTSTGEAFGWIKRGPNLRSGRITLSFNVFPTRIDPSAGLYVSASLGGDSTVPSRESDGYTTASGTVLPDRSTTFVWQLGTPRVSSDDGVTRVVTRSLDYTLNAWNSYTIDVTDAIEQAFPDPATRPADLNALLFVKMAAGSRAGGQAEGWFDSLALDAANASTKSAAAAQAAAADFVARNAVISTWDTPTFKLLPSQEMGFNDHAQRLHYPISDVSQWEQFSKGVMGIPAVQASGYPAQLNHPGLPGGVTDDEALTNQAYGADLMEAVERGTNDVMIRDWDALLHSGEPLVGTWTSDSHRNATFGPTTYVQAPVLSQPELLHSLFEGRAFLAPVDFTGTVSFAPDDDGGSYPSRYPVYRSADDDLATAYLDIDGGLEPGSTVLWLRDGQVVRSEPVSGSSYSAALTTSLPTGSTPLRAEVRRPDGSRALMTEPLMMRTVPGLPHGIVLHVERVSTPSATGYTRSVVRGITGVSWDGASGVLTTTLTNPAGSTTEQVVATGSYQPAAVAVDGTSLPEVASRALLEGGTTDGWAYDGAAHELVVRATQSGGTASLAVSLAPGADTTAPTAPVVSALAEDANHVTVSWPPASDDTGVVRYRISRNGTTIAAVPGDTLSFSDGGVSPDTSYAYAVRAEDAATNLSPPGASNVTTQPVVTTTVTASADTYVTSTAPGANYGTAKTMKADASPDTFALLRFPLPGAGARVVGASVELTSTATLSSGVRFWSLTSHTWGERDATYANAPARGSQVGTSPPMAAARRTSSDVTPYAQTLTSSYLDLAITNPSATNVSLYTRENGTSVPQLVIRSSTVAPHADPLAVTTQEDSTATFAPLVSGGAGPLTCSISSPPSSGTAWVAPDCSSGQVTPGRDQTGSSSFRYAVTDGAQTVSATVTLTTTPVNDAPTTDPEELGAGTDEGTPVTLVLRGDDVDGDCPLSFTLLQQPVHGTLGALGAPSCAAGAATVAVTYTPDEGFSGSDSLGYRVTDPAGAASAPATFDVTVAGSNSPPTAQSGSTGTDEDTPVTLTLRADDPNGDCPLAFAIVSGPALGSLGSLGAATCAAGTATATVTYTPAPDRNGTDGVAFRASDPSGASSAPATVSVAVAPVNDAPSAGSVTVDATGTQTASFALPVSDVDSASLTCSLASPAAKGTVTVAGDCSGGTYTAAPGTSGSDSFTYSVSDGAAGSSATGSVTITPATSTLLVDGFESGTLSQWARAASAVITTATPRSGSYALDLDSTSSGFAYVRTPLPAGLTTTDLSAGVRIVTRANGSAVTLLRSRAGDDTALVSVQVDSSGRLKLRNEVTRVTQTSSTLVPVGSWVLLSLRVTTNGAASTLEVLLDGTPVPGLSSTSDLGSYRVGSVQLGENARGPGGRVLFDDVLVTGS